MSDKFVSYQTIEQQAIDAILSLDEEKVKLVLEVMCDNQYFYDYLAEAFTYKHPEAAKMLWELGADELNAALESRKWVAQHSIPEEFDGRIENSGENYRDVSNLCRRILPNKLAMAWPTMFHIAFCLIKAAWFALDDKPEAMILIWIERALKPFNKKVKDE